MGGKSWQICLEIHQLGEILGREEFYRHGLKVCGGDCFYGLAGFFRGHDGAPGEEALAHGEALGFAGFRANGQLAKELLAEGLEAGVGEGSFAEARKDAPDRGLAFFKIGPVAAKGNGHYARILILSVGALDSVHPATFFAEFCVQK